MATAPHKPRPLPPAELFYRRYSIRNRKTIIGIGFRYDVPSLGMAESVKQLKKIYAEKFENLINSKGGEVSSGQKKRLRKPSFRNVLARILLIETALEQYAIIAKQKQPTAEEKDFKNYLIYQLEEDKKTLHTLHEQNAKK